MSTRPLRARAAAVVVSLVAAASPLGLQAQAGGGDGFLFGAPRWAFTLRAGYDQPAARGALFDRIGDELTLERSSYGAVNLGADLAVRLTPRLDMAFGAGWARSNARSEYVDFVEEDENGAVLPIEQRTRFTRVPVTATVRAFLVPRGQSLSRFAWVPSAVAPYVGVGGGVMYHSFTQSGDFIVDPETLDILPQTRESSRWTPTAHALAGAEFSLSPRLALATEARYTVARAPAQLFVPGGPDRIDLSGLQATVGLSVRF